MFYGFLWWVLVVFVAHICMIDQPVKARLSILHTGIYLTEKCHLAEVIESLLGQSLPPPDAMVRQHSEPSRIGLALHKIL